MRVHLQINSTPPRKVYLRDGYVYQVGRTDASDIVIPDDGHLSSVHFSLELRSGICLLRDVRSANGTSVNGKLTTERKLQNGDTILAGRTTFMLHVEGGAAPPGLTETRVLPAAPAETVIHEAPPRRPAEKAPAPAARPEPPSPIKPAAPRATKRSATFPDFELGWQDPDPSVRREAMLAAVWGRQNWVMDRLRAIVRVSPGENVDALWLLGVLGDPGDLPLVQSIVSNRRLGSERCDLLGAYGHPEVIPELLNLLADPDPLIASAAGSAYLKITGFNLRTGRRQLPAAENADAFEIEFAPEVEVVDPHEASERWRREASKFGSGVRWCRGHNVSDGAGAVLEELDLPSRGEAILRDHFRAVAPGSPRDLVKFVRPHRA
jgi:hypothetical protein